MTSMTLRPVHLLLVLLFVILQVFLWLGDGGFVQYDQVRQEIEKQQLENQTMQIRNNALAAAIVALQQEDNRHSEIEGLAREELGMVRKGETFFYISD